LNFDFAWIVSVLEFGNGVVSKSKCNLTVKIHIIIIILKIIPPKTFRALKLFNFYIFKLNITCWPPTTCANNNITKMIEIENIEKKKK
jgi:hypothetical protein